MTIKNVKNGIAGDETQAYLAAFIFEESFWMEDALQLKQ